MELNNEELAAARFNRSIMRTYLVYTLEVPFVQSSLLSSYATVVAEVPGRRRELLEGEGSSSSSDMVVVALRIGVGRRCGWDLLPPRA
jgi:hypothetical protein